MIQTILRSSIRRFAKKYNYDADFMVHVVDASTIAGLRLSALPVYGGFRGPKVSQDVWNGALLGSTQEGDCGPCVQVIVDMALEVGTPAGQLASCLRGESHAAGDVGLGYQFARAAIAGGPDLEDLRDQIDQRFGVTAVIAASIAASYGRVYPVLKRGLGFGQTCTSIVIDGESIRTQRQS